MNNFGNFKFWIEQNDRKTFNNVKDAIKIQLHPIKLKNDKEINTKRISEFDEKIIKDNIFNWKMFEDLSKLAKDQITQIISTKNGTIADIINLIVNDHKN